MGREVRRVPPDWQHPKDASGKHIPLLVGGHWDIHNAKWNEGLRDDHRGGWQPLGEFSTISYSEFAGPRPADSKCAPDWPAFERTHVVLYECTTEGTPLSPIFATVEDLARWVTDDPIHNHEGFSFDEWVKILGSALARGGAL